MRRLQAIAAIVALAVICWGYSVVRELAAERPGYPSVELQSAAGTSTSPGGSTTGARAPGQSASAGNALPLVPNVAGADILPRTVEGATVPASTETSAAPAALQGELPASLSHVPFLQAAFSDAQAGAVAGAHGRPVGAFGSGAVPPMSGFGSAGGASAGLPAANSDTAAAGDGTPSVLGHRFRAEIGEPNQTTTSNENGSSGSNGSNGGNGSTDHNGDANGNSGSNGSGSNDQNGDGNGNNGKNAGNGSNGDNGSNGGNGGDQGGVTEGGINTLAVSLVDESPTTTGGNDVRDVPEPGSILLGLGAVAALARRAKAARCASRPKQH